ncbi:hypothetical protein KJZ61_04580 [Candidatus Dependentiae bacterium]|nr:hypothetical protein [Candidatus Dependentiae bacterium]
MIIIRHHFAIFVTIFLLTMAAGSNAHTQGHALVVVPIADLYGAIPNNTYIPMDAQPAPLCPRLMQALFNEHVEILKEQHDHALIKITHAFHHPYNRPTKILNTYWISKAAIAILDSLPAETHKVIPPPITWTNPTSVAQQRIATLCYPWHDRTSDTTYSAGTRFVITKSSKKHFSVAFWNARTQKIISSTIPKHLCSSLKTDATSQERQAACVALTRSWAHSSPGIIPYIFGGCSMTIPYDPYQPVISSIQPHASNVIDHAHKTMQPHTGFDCAGLVLRAAQCCGIPYFFKNTTALAQGLRALRPNESLENGDLIWTPGHVMMVSDIKKNLLVEARSFYHGYGKVQEIPIGRQFLNIATYQDMCAAFFNHQRLKRLDIAGNVVQELPFKLLKFSSVWDQKKR